MSPPPSSPEALPSAADLAAAQRPPDGPDRLRVVVIDDEPAARRGVRLLLEQEPDMLVVGEAADGESAVELIDRERPDLAFLDVQMPELDGFEVLRRVGAGSLGAVIFITAHDEHALRAFDVHAVDYLLKPYEDERFRQAVARARGDLRRRESAQLDERLRLLLEAWRPPGNEAAGASSALSSRILVKASGEIFFLKQEEIDWIEAEGDYVKFHLAERSYLMRETMARLETRLDPARFIRIHRSTIVNIDRVRKLSPSFCGEYAVILQDGSKLKLSRGYQEKLQRMMRDM